MLPGRPHHWSSKPDGAADNRPASTSDPSPSQLRQQPNSCGCFACWCPICQPLGGVIRDQVLYAHDLQPNHFLICGPRESKVNGYSQYVRPLSQPKRCTAFGDIGADLEFGVPQTS